MALLDYGERKGERRRKGKKGEKGNKCGKCRNWIYETGIVHIYIIVLLFYMCIYLKYATKNRKKLVTAAITNVETN